MIPEVWRQRNYAKFIFHVLETGFSSIFELPEQSHKPLQGANRRGTSDTAKPCPNHISLSENSRLRHVLKCFEQGFDHTENSSPSTLI